MDMKEAYKKINNSQVTVFLNNGVKLNGVVSRLKEDSQEFLLSRDGITQIVFKNNVATIMPKCVDGE